MRRAGFVLSGGASRRMGRDKALLSYRGMALAAWVAARVEEAAGRVSLVGGGEKYIHLGYPVLSEAYEGSGPLSGIEAALRQGGAEWSLVVACDMAGVRAEWLRELLHTAEQSGSRAVYACCSDGAWEPLCAVYHEDCLPEAQSMLLEGAFKATVLLNRVNGLAWRAGWADQLRNINTPSDWAAVKDEG